jgi:hypothetical protein
MDAHTRAYFGSTNVALESLDIASTPVASKCELALTSLVVAALVVGAAIVSIAALAQQPQYGSAGISMLEAVGSAATADTAMALGSYNEAEAPGPRPPSTVLEGR